MAFLVFVSAVLIAICVLGLIVDQLTK